jgi:cell wall assembly regulator SMI1
VQVVDPRINRELEQRLERQLLAITRLRDGQSDRVAPLELLPGERQWLLDRSSEELQAWREQLLQAQRRMLQQGVIGSVAERQLLRPCSWRA